MAPATSLNFFIDGPDPLTGVERGDTYWVRRCVTALDAEDASPATPTTPPSATTLDSVLGDSGP